MIYCLFINRNAHNVFNRLGDVINSWRKKELKLDVLPAFMGATIVDYLRIPHTYCWSPALVRKPADWRPEIGM
jgi:hypothetical protein